MNHEAMITTNYLYTSWKLIARTAMIVAFRIILLLQIWALITVDKNRPQKYTHGCKAHLIKVGWFPSFPGMATRMQVNSTIIMYKESVISFKICHDVALMSKWVNSSCWICYWTINCENPHHNYATYTIIQYLFVL